MQTLHVRVESQAVVLRELSQPTLSTPAHMQPYESHEYDEIGNFKERENYEQIGPSQTHPLKKGYNFTSCPAYAPTKLSEGKKTTPSASAP